MAAGEAKTQKYPSIEVYITQLRDPLFAGFPWLTKNFFIKRPKNLYKIAIFVVYFNPFISILLLSNLKFLA